MYGLSVGIPWIIKLVKSIEEVLLIFIVLVILLKYGAPVCSGVTLVILLVICFFCYHRFNSMLAQVMLGRMVDEIHSYLVFEVVYCGL